MEALTSIEEHIPSDEISILILDLQKKTLRMNHTVVSKALTIVLNTDSDELKSRGRKQELAMKRHLFVFLMYNLTRLSLSSIAKMLNRDHSTMINSRRAIVDEFTTNKQYVRDVILILEEFNGLLT